MTRARAEKDREKNNQPEAESDSMRGGWRRLARAAEDERTNARAAHESEVGGETECVVSCSVS